MPAERVICLLEEIISEKGRAVNIRCDNGTEFISHAFQDGAVQRDQYLVHTAGLRKETTVSTNVRIEFLQFDLPFCGA